MGTKQSTAATSHGTAKQENTPTTIDDQINDILDENVAASQRAKEEAEAIAKEATETSTKIHHQGDQIHNIHVKANKTEKNAQKGKSEAIKLEWCECWYRCFHNEQGTSEDPGDKVVPTKSAHHTHSHSNEPIVEPIIDDPREDEINDNLKDVQKALDVISDENYEIGAELDKQNTELEDINGTVTKTGDILSDATDILKKHE